MRKTFVWALMAIFAVSSSAFALKNEADPSTAFTPSVAITNNNSDGSSGAPAALAATDVADTATYNYAGLIADATFAADPMVTETTADDDCSIGTIRTEAAITTTELQAHVTSSEWNANAASIIDFNLFPTAETLSATRTANGDGAVTLGASPAAEVKNSTVKAGIAFSGPNNRALLDDGLTASATVTIVESAITESLASRFALASARTSTSGTMFPAALSAGVGMTESPPLSPGEQLRPWTVSGSINLTTVSANASPPTSLLSTTTEIAPPDLSWVESSWVEIAIVRARADIVTVDVAPPAASSIAINAPFVSRAAVHTEQLLPCFAPVSARHYAPADYVDSLAPEGRFSEI